MMDVWDPGEEMTVFSQIKKLIAGSQRALTGWVVRLYPGNLVFRVKDWFLNISVAGLDFRELFQIRAYNLSVAVWVGFLALFGIATDDGVIISTYLKQVFDRKKPSTVFDIREATVEAGKRRIRPALMTVATTILALIPVLTSSGRGADVMIPMAIPSFGGMTVVLVTVFTVPTLYCALAEMRLKKKEAKA